MYWPLGHGIHARSAAPVPWKKCALPHPCCGLHAGARLLSRSRNRGMPGSDGSKSASQGRQMPNTKPLARTLLVGRYEPEKQVAWGLHCGCLWLVSSIHVNGGHLVQTPSTSADAPFMYSPALQTGWLWQVKPSVVPAHFPCRYSLAPQVMNAQVVQAPLLSVDEPLR